MVRIHTYLFGVCFPQVPLASLIDFPVSVLGLALAAAWVGRSVKIISIKHLFPARGDMY